MRFLLHISLIFTYIYISLFLNKNKTVKQQVKKNNIKYINDLLFHKRIHLNKTFDFFVAFIYSE